MISTYPLTERVLRFFCISLAIAPAMLLPLACNRGDKSDSNSSRPRIISHTPSITQIIFALDLGDNLVGVSNWCHLPSEGKYSQIPRVCDADGVRAETALSLEPDIIFTQVDPSRKMFSTVKRHLPDVKIEQIKIESFGDIFAAVKKIGDLTDHQIQANKLIGEMEEKLSVLDNHGEYSLSGKKFRVVFISGSRSPMIAADGTFIADMIHRAGAVNAGNDIPGNQLWRKAKVESVITVKPDVLIIWVSPGQKDTVEKFWLARKEIPAARNGRVYVVSDNRWVRPGPDVCDVASELRKMIPVVKK